MRGLYLRIAISAFVAVIVAGLAVQLFTLQFRARFAPGAVGPGATPIDMIALRLEQLPDADWPAAIAQAQRELRMPLSVVTAEALPPAVLERRVLPRARLAENGQGMPSLYVPLRGGAHYLVAAAPAPPSPLPLVAGVAVFVCVLTLTMAATVGIPLMRRLQTLRRAVVELGSGNWSVRVPSAQGGALDELAESIRRTADQLRRQFEEREALLQVASHEIGTPLARMRFQLGMLEDELSDGRGRVRVRAMSVDLDELDTVSTDLVAWMETDGGSRINRVDVALAPLLRSLAELEQAAAGGRISVDMRVAQDVTAHVDERQFQRAIENLMRNAFRYAQGVVVVDAVVTQDTVVVEVRDDGPGISAENRRRVLEPFVRVDSGVTRAHRGLGLGLAIVRRIVDAHRGSIAVTSAGEGGTCVRTEWPRWSVTPRSRAQAG